MASIANHIAIEHELRPAFVYGDKTYKVLFHKWIGDKPVEALVEFEDGSMGQVIVNDYNFRFLDSKQRFSEIYFGETGEKKVK